MACRPDRLGRKQPSAVRHVHAVCSNVLHDNVKEINSRRNSKRKFSTGVHIRVRITLG